MIVAGVDEAGRGCVIGPLVVAGLAVKTEDLPQLITLGVKDSKMLTPKKREALYPEIIKLTHSYQTIKVLPYLIDKAVRSKRALYKLNRLEAQTMAKIIEQLKPDQVYVDAADVVQERFGIHIQECLTVKTSIVSEHKADKTYPIVSAASVIAKVERDREIENLKAKYGDFGSGYLTDEKTTGFLKRLLVENDGEYPSCVRKSWAPARKTKSDYRFKQRTLI
jgi:ribonuclease HII